jgi:hypothetical protein
MIAIAPKTDMCWCDCTPVVLLLYQPSQAWHVVRERPGDKEHGATVEMTVISTVPWHGTWAMRMTCDCIEQIGEYQSGGAVPGLASNGSSHRDVQATADTLSCMP